MKTLSKAAETQLLDVVQRMSKLAEEGLHPTEALIKAAQEAELAPSCVPLAARAYNVGRQTLQRKEAANVLDKLAEFPLADADAAMAKLYGPVEKPAEAFMKTAVAECYQGRPKFIPAPSIPTRTPLPETVKAAFAAPPAAAKTVKQASVGDEMVSLRSEQSRLEEERRQYGEAKVAFVAALDEFAAYFKQAAATRRPFAEIALRSRRLFGKAAEHLLTFAVQRTGNERLLKEAALSAPPPLERQTAPYSLMQRCLDAGTRLKQASVYLSHKQAFDAKRQRLFPAASRPAPEAGEPPKAAAGVMDFALGGLTRHALGQFTAKPTEKLVADQAAELEDPAHEAELQKIRVQAMLQDMLSNDEVISAHDPDEVLRHYNDLAQAMPTVAVQPAIIRPLLRKRLTQGGAEPFEAAEGLNMERTLRQNRSSMHLPPSMPHAPANTILS